MLIDVLVGNPWLVALVWGMLSVFDFSATMLYSKVYRDHLSAKIIYEGGMEMNPTFEKDVQQVRWFSPRYIVLMLAVVFLIGLVGMWLPPFWFEGLAGAALLLLLFIDLRHIENLGLVWFLKSDPDSLKGIIEQSYRLSQRRVALGVLITGLLYSVIALLVQRVFFAGGATICALFAVRHFLLANRQLKKPATQV